MLSNSTDRSMVSIRSSFVYSLNKCRFNSFAMEGVLSAAYVEYQGNCKDLCSPMCTIGDIYHIVTYNCPSQAAH